MAQKIPRDLVKEFCINAGFDPKFVAAVTIRPESVLFEIYVQPLQRTHDGPLTVFTTLLVE